MKKLFSAVVLCGVVGGAMGVAGQGQPQPTPAEAPRPVVMSGCLNAWDGKMSSAPTPEMPTPASAPAQFVLTNAVEEPAATAPSPAGTPETLPPSGVATAQKSGMAHASYLLRTEGQSVDLRSHVGHKVQLTGTLAPGKPGAATRPSAPEAAKSGQAGATTLTVMALKMISTTCP